ncbi:cobalt ECF transporter T component CbiQ [Leptolyngbya sp. FACHB-711]|uniref:cobalt ECF transporter T component CbiQ n=1 Tax=unclassified Leptolyngbya TaxID=2650499 RepID=UPI001683D371|nr:cobalt ECF transporter T component CbiQ [Leptolyngbya sp. FACHB-711]MBD1849339.1 cobalt ECF transporter T component CbiQ [Cyanobacteria bacterium FACHB-502]MBD2024700.1 cobalt ECF transporter T component CbiQ [Leptolyngbya sp. FACHB-711]
MLLHIGAFHLDIDSQQTTPWHRLIPRTRVICALLFVFATALTPNGRWLTWLVYGLGLLSLILTARLTLPVLLRRVAVEFTFVGVVIVGTLFREGGTVLWQWGWLKVTTVGLTVLGSVALKALLSLLMLNLLVLTTSIPALLNALADLKMPPLLIAIIASMYRYINVLVDEFNTMRRAAQSRNLLNHRGRQRLVFGNMIGSLFVRTYERGDRIHQAMLSRGYQNIPPLQEHPRPGRIDTIAITMMILLLLLGQAVLLGF